MMVNETTKISIGICAYNEEENIGILLDNLLSKQNLPRNSDIIVVCCGTDSTPEIVRGFSNRDSRVKLIVEDKRRGKAAALNVLFREARSSDVLVLINADCLPAPGSIDKLIRPLRDPNVGATVGRPQPINEKKGIANLITHLIWNLHHETSLRTVKMSGELCAIRTKLVERIPTNVATDEPYIQRLVQQQGYKIIYVPEAVVYMRGPSNLRELLEQRRRINAGHLQIKWTANFVVPTLKLRNILPALTRVLNSLNVKGLAIIFLGLLLETCARLLARYDLSKGRIPYMWKVLKSTKKLY